MSNSLAIAAVTATLQNLIYQAMQNALGSGKVTTLPLDKARENSEQNQINIFLYHTLPNLAWRNRHPVAQLRRGESQKSPLGLDLFYLISVYGEKENGVKSHQLLGQIMSLFHDLSKITPEMIETATNEELRDSNLHQQIETINITPLALTYEEIYQIWQGFQVPFRPSVAYQVSVILLDSLVSLTVPMPVLAQGNGKTQVGQTGFLPSLQALELPNRQPSVQLGDTLTLRGNNLEQEGLHIRLIHSKFKQIIELEPLESQNTHILTVKIPDPDQEQAQPWQIGLYTLSLIMLQVEQGVRVSNELPFNLAPRIVALSPKQTRAGDISLRLSCTPALHPRQKAILLWGDRSFPTRKRSNPEPGATTSLTCQIKSVLQGEYVVRLRVDGVDSLPVDFSTFPWQFDPNQKVIVRA
jgi:hypothetical protein